MTRTERNIYPHALAKDRSVSKSGLDKSLPKNGAGPHNWGSLAEQTHPYIHHNLDNAKLSPQNQNYKGAEGDIDLETDEDAQDDQLAASPSTAATLHAHGGNEQQESNATPIGGAQRRMSNMTEEEREKAREWRHGAMNRDSIDLAAIARTSGAFSQSPTNADAMLSTSPVMNMSAMAGKLNRY